MTIDLNLTKKHTVYMPAPFTPEATAYAQEKFNLLRPGDLPEDEILAQAEGILLRISSVTADQISRAPKLKIISRNGVGYDSIDKPACLKRGIVVTNMPGTNSQAVAELVITMALSLLRRVSEVAGRIRNGETVPSISAIAPGLYGKTLGLIGMGDIARETAKIFHYGFGCHIVVFSPTSPLDRWTASSSAKDEVIIPHIRAISLQQVLEQSDVLSIHCPYTAGTRNMISTKEFEWMKSSSIIINTARGGIVDEDALYHALTTDQVAGAGIDVWITEPPTRALYGKFFDLPNVIALPHLGGSTEEAQRKGCMGAVDIVVDYLAEGVEKNRVY